jgi:hypothetical protein
MRRQKKSTTAKKSVPAIKKAPDETPIDTPTVADIQGKTVIQLHTIIREHYPQFDDLLSIFNRDELREAFARKLNEVNDG